MANKEAKVVEEQELLMLKFLIFLKNIMDYVEDNIDKKITISDLANRSRWKEQHFIRVLLIILEKHLISIF
jgi:hypothetical protein